MNVDVSGGLTNDAMGTVKNVIKWSRDGKQIIEAILVEFDSTKIGTEAFLHSKYKDFNDWAVPIECI